MNLDKNNSFTSFNIFAIGFLSATVVLFIFWGLGYTKSNHSFVFILAALFGLFMAFNIGGNDVANSFGTSVGAGTLSIQQALAIAAIFELSGALIAGGEVTNTIRNGIANFSEVDIQPMAFVFVMMSALVAAAAWLLFATKMGWPVSTTHSIVGAIVGATLTLGIILKTGKTLDLIHWQQIGYIVMSWVISPILGGSMSYVIFSFIKKRILVLGEIDHEQYSRRANALRGSFGNITNDTNKEEPKDEGQKCIAEQMQSEPKISLVKSRLTQNLDDLGTMLEGTEGHEPQDKNEYDQARLALRVLLPLLAVFGILTVAYMYIFKGLKNLNLGFNDTQYIFIFSLIGIITWFVAYIFTKRFRSKELSRATYIFFSWMQIATASCFAFSHGSNDIANAIGPFAAILEVLKTNTLGNFTPVPLYAMLAFGIALVAGLWFIGKEVIATVGTNLARMSPASGFTAELAAAIVVLLASSFGMPVSSTHILVGAILGIGIVNNNANWRLMKPIGLAWIITVPAAAIFSSITFVIFHFVFNF